MKKRIFITGQKNWEGDVTLDFNDSEGRPCEWNLPLGSIDLEVPNDIIPSKPTWNAMMEKHKLKCAKHKVTEMEVRLKKAEEELADLLCLPSSI